MPVIRPHWRHIARFAISEQRYVTTFVVEAIDLEKLVSADIFREHKRSAGGRRKLCAADRVRIERQLRACSAWHLHQVDLSRIGEACRDQHLPLDRIPAGSAKIG